MSFLQQHKKNKSFIAPLQRGVKSSLETIEELQSGHQGMKWP